jgi:hypothetical protein
MMLLFFSLFIGYRWKDILWLYSDILSQKKIGQMFFKGCEKKKRKEKRIACL